MDNETNINEQLDILEETKQQLKEAIISKGQEISEEDSFRSYVGKIDNIEVLNAQTKSVTPTTNQQVIEPDNNYNALSQVTVEAVTSAIDNNIQSNNIKSGVSILGVNGNVIELNGDTETVTPTTSQQIITPTSPKNGLTQVTVNPVTSAIDSNIQAQNIKNGVEILGVTGTLEGGIDTSDATAVASDIEIGKTAYVNGTKITGSLNIADTSQHVLSNGSPSDVTSVTPTSTIRVFKATYITPESLIVKPNTEFSIAVTNSKLAELLDLTANKIKSGETISGITGTYTSDANAVASNIEIGKTAYVNGEKITGTLNVVDNQGHQVTNSDSTAVTLNWDMGSALLLETVYGPATPVIIKPNDNFSMAINKSTLASIINLTADKIKLGETILGITGTYSDAMKSYNSETAMNNDIANIAEGEVVKVVENNTTTFYIKETTMKKLVKEEDTLSPTEYTEALEDVDDILGEEVV